MTVSIASPALSAAAGKALEWSATGAKDRCQRLPLSQQLRSLAFAVWLPEEQSFVVSDRLAKKLYTLFPDGRFAPGISSARHPVAAFPVDKMAGGRLVDRQLLLLSRDLTKKLNPEYLERFDTRLRSQGQAPIRQLDGASGIDGWDIMATFWLAEADGAFVGYGALSDRTTGPSWDTIGFFTAEVGAGATAVVDGSVQLIEALPSGQDYYMVEHDYLSAVGADVYYVRLSPTDSSPSLFRYQPGADPAGPFEVTGSPLDAMPTPAFSLDGAHSYLELQERLDQFDGPASLSAADGLLYLTTRAPSPSGAGTQWAVTTLLPQPETNSVLDLGTVYLPTSTSSMTMTQSATSVFVFERGRYRNARGEQVIDDVLVFPKRWIKDTRTSPLRVPSRFVTCSAAEAGF